MFEKDLISIVVEWARLCCENKQPSPSSFSNLTGLAQHKLGPRISFLMQMNHQSSAQ